MSEKQKVKDAAKSVSLCHDRVWSQSRGNQRDGLKFHKTQSTIISDYTYTEKCDIT